MAFLLPVEIEIQRGGIPGSHPTWMSQSGIVRDLVAVWDSGGKRNMDWLRVRVKIAGMTSPTQLRPALIQWEIPNHPSPSTDSFETDELRWPGDFGVKMINIDVAGAKFRVYVDVPDVGTISQNEWNELMASQLGGMAGALAAYAYNVSAGNWANNQGVNESRENALKHSYWMSRCASDVLIGPNWALLLGLAHEYEGKNGNTDPEKRARPFGATMDLRNNWIGTKVVDRLSITGHSLQSALLTKLQNGELWIWDHPGHDTDGIQAIKRSDNQAIFEQP